MIIKDYCYHYFFEQTNKQTTMPKKISTKTNEPINREENLWTVERIIATRQRKGVRQYLVKWEGWDETNNTWEPEMNIFDPELIYIFEQELQEQKQQSLTTTMNSTTNNKNKKLGRPRNSLNSSYYNHNHNQIDINNESIITPKTVTKRSKQSNIDKSRKSSKRIKKLWSTDDDDNNDGDKNKKKENGSLHHHHYQQQQHSRHYHQSNNKNKRILICALIGAMIFAILLSSLPLLFVTTTPSTISTIKPTITQL